MNIIQSIYRVTIDLLTRYRPIWTNISVYLDWRVRTRFEFERVGRGFGDVRVWAAIHGLVLL